MPSTMSTRDTLPPTLSHPDANHGNPGRMLERNGNQMVASSSVRRQPHVNVIARFVYAIDEIRDNARIVSVLG